MTRIPSFAAKVLASTALLGLVTLTAAAQVGPRARITQAINPAQLTTLNGNVHPLAQPRFDQGPAPADLPMDRMLLVLKRSADQETALQTLMAAQQSPGSAQYHQWLTPLQFGEQFGVAPEDIQTITNWLSGQGFTVNQVATAANVIEFSGTAAQVAVSLHTQIHQYVVNGQAHWANATNPQIPAALAPVVAGVASLNNFPKRTGQARGLGSSAVAQPGQAVPNLTDNKGDHALVPGDFATIYNANPLYTASSPIDGSGQRIAIVGRTNINLLDVSDFRSLFLPTYPSQPVTILLNGADPGDLGGDDEAEADFDVEWSGSVAPKASIELVVSATTDTTDGVDLSAEYIVENNVAPVMSTSFSACEADLGTTELQFVGAVAEQAAAQGITVINSSGDSGAAECDDDTAAAAANGLAVNGLAATPFTVAVGGTEFNEAGGSGSYWNATTSTSATNYASAKSYIPETAWNESCSSAVCGSNAEIFASGGGASTYFTEKPEWQNATGVPQDGVRDLPDVAFAAGGKEGYVVCQRSVASCASVGGTFQYQVFGGTSGAAPAFAGVMALVNEKMGSIQGQADYELYRLGQAENWAACNAASGTPASTCIFLDTTSGNNSVPCVAGSTGCTSLGGTNTLIGYNANTGYDQVTGLGSINIANLVNGWSAATSPLTPSTTALVLSATQFTHGQTITFRVNVGPTIGPTGDVVLMANTNLQAGANGYAVDAFTIGDGSCNSTPATCVTNTDNGFPGGTYTVTARYEGDANFAPSTSAPVSVTVAPEASTTSVAPLEFDSGGNSYQIATAFYGDFVYPKASVVGNALIALDYEVDDGVPTGTVQFQDGGGAVNLPGYASSVALNSEGVAAYPNGVTDFSVGNHALGGAYSGDNSFLASSATVAPFTVVQSPTSVAVTTTGAGAVTLLANVTTLNSSEGAPPSGTVTFYSGATKLGTVNVAGTTDPTTGFVSASASLSESSAPANLSATYSGDTNYTAANTQFTTAPNTYSASVTAGQTASYSLAVTPAGGFSGTVALACGAVPTGATCTISPAAVSLTGSAAVVATVSVTTTAHTSAAPPVGPAPGPPNWRFLLLVVMGLSAAASLMLQLGARRRMALPVLGLLLLSLGAAACGGGSSSTSSTGSSGSTGGTTGNPTTGTAAGSYSFVVTATAGNSTATQQFNLIVN